MAYQPTGVLVSLLKSRNTAATGQNRSFTVCLAARIFKQKVEPDYCAVSFLINESGIALYSQLKRKIELDL